MKVLPASVQRKKLASTSIVSSGANSLMIPTNLSKQVVALHLPLKNSSYDSENSVGGSPRDSIRSVPNRPMSHYVFPRSPKHMKVGREVTQ